jgi:hypothetical protein
MAVTCVVMEDPSSVSRTELPGGAQNDFHREAVYSQNDNELSLILFCADMLKAIFGKRR